MSKPFDLDLAREPVWPIELRPIGEETAHKEPFRDWWQRHSYRLSHLPPDLAEQWIHRHWLNSPFAFLPLDDLLCERRTWSGERSCARSTGPGAEDLTG
jgi:hypothetical protein